MPIGLDWLIARPIAHRGLHDAAHGLIENTAGAVRAAIAANYGIEVDVQISADGEAMVHHDDVLGRLTQGEGRLDRLNAAALKRVPFRGSDERMLTLGELCDLVDGRVTMLVELKSRFDGDEQAAGTRRHGARRLSRACGADVVRPATNRGSAAQSAATCPRHRCRQIPAASILGSDAVLDALRNGISRHRIGGASAIRGLCSGRLAGFCAARRAARFWLAAIDLGGAERSRAGNCRTLRRPDDLRRFSAMIRVQNDAVDRVERAMTMTGTAHRRGRGDR